MRLLTALLALAFLSGTVLAQDVKIPEEKEWHYDLANLRNIPEVEPNDTCPGQPIMCADVVDANLATGTDVDWFQFEVTVPGTVLTIGTDAGPAPDARDTKLYLFAADCTTQLAYNDDGGPGYYSLITYTAATAGMYNIKVTPYSTSYSGNYILFVTCSEPSPPPVNDTCAGAIELTCGQGVVAGDLTWANNDYNLVSPSCTGYTTAGRDVAYVMNLLAGDNVHLFYAGGYDEALYIVTDCADVQNTCLIGRDATVATGETIDWVAPADGTYYVICDAYGTNVGNDFTMDYVITCGPPLGACCLPDYGPCEDLSEADCAAAGGEWHGDVLCANYECPTAPPVWACCLPDYTCQDLTEAECVAGGGVLYPNVLCASNPCPLPPVWACCLPDCSCVMLTEVDCIGQGGIWYADDDCADPTPCGMTPVAPDSWGEIKSVYR